MKIKPFHFCIVRTSKLRANLNVEGSGAVVRRLWIFTNTGIMECYFMLYLQRSQLLMETLLGAHTIITG